MKKFALIIVTFFSSSPILFLPFQVQCQGQFNWQPNLYQQQPSLEQQQQHQPNQQQEVSDGGMLSNLSNSFWSLTPSFVQWLISNERWTTYDKSDVHDVSWTQSDREASNWSSSSSSDGDDGMHHWWDSAAVGGRQLFNQMNSITVGYESILQAMSCISTGTWTDPDLGTFGQNASVYCDPKSGRFIPGVTCCVPAPPGLLDVKLRLKIKGQPERLLNFRNPENRKFLTAPGRVVFIVHGWFERMSSVNWITDMRNGFEDLDDNAIVVDWRRGNAVHYWQAMANTRVVGAMIGRAVLNWEIANRTLVVGFSLGGQMINEAGRFTQIHGGVKINECHGLDPAGPFYDGGSTELILDKSDCEIVQAIHTSAEDMSAIGALAVSFGTYEKSGHCDFWINCGYNQGPCFDIDFKDFLKASTRLWLMSDGEMINWVTSRACSHWRSPQIYVSSLRRRCDRIRNPLVAYPCPNCGAEHTCINTNSLPQSNNTLIPFSQCSSQSDENYYVSSRQYEPHCPIEGQQIGEQ